MPLPHLPHLPHDAPLSAYEARARTLLERWRAGDPEAIDVVRRCHPRFVDPAVPWKPGPAEPVAEHANACREEDARLVVARWHDFRDEAALARYVAEVADRAGQPARFEAAVEAVVDGDLEALAAALQADPALAHARSTRVTPFDPPTHRATLLHYVAANGVEGFRQRTPPNVLAIAGALLDAGAEVDALAFFYGGATTTLPLLVSSDPVARSGHLAALVDLFADHGATLEPKGHGTWRSPLATALAFSRLDAAEALVRRGARIATLADAAGLGRLDDVRRRIAEADPADRHRALALTAQNGHAELVAFLLAQGEDPDRANPEGCHAHATPLHQAALAGHLAVVRCLVERGARLDQRDAIWNGTPLDWAEHAGQEDVARFLRTRLEP